MFISTKNRLSLISISFRRNFFFVCERRLEVVKEVKIWLVVLQVMMPCSLVGGYPHFGAAYSPHPEVRK